MNPDVETRVAREVTGWFESVISGEPTELVSAERDDCIGSWRDGDILDGLTGSVEQNLILLDHISSVLRSVLNSVSK